ncbi:hypothetical protein N7454_005965 [Penicillium verhagenii]|nr:hypothetical protein N7454_005965 [Penicillium verhagenii]
MERPSGYQNLAIHENEVNAPQKTQKWQRSLVKMSKSHGIVLGPLVTCLFILLAFWRQYNVTDPLRSKNPGKLSNSHEATSFPGVQLHPEDHASRDPEIQHLNWVLSTENLRPDGVLKRARSGDTLIINVTNTIEESLSIHWHGLHTENQMDGASSVTQCPILPGSSFIYNLTIPSDQSGTFWYHAHTGFARADGLYGGFVVHDLAESTVPASRPYDKEVLLLIGDWYHRSAGEVMSWYMRAGSFGNDPVPDSLLINGAGHFECPMAVPARPVDCNEKHVNLSYFHTPTDTSYRLRVVNTGSLAGFTLISEADPMSIIGVDSVELDPQEAHSVGVLYPGQRMDLILHVPVQGKPSALQIKLDTECFKYPNPALNPTQTFSINSGNSANTQASYPVKTNDTDLDIHKIPSPEHILALLEPHANVTEVVYSKTQKLSINHNVPFGFFNHTSWKPQSDPPAPLNCLPHDKWDKNQLSLFVPDPENMGPVWVDLVVNNLDDTGHPFHLHGYHFYILNVYKAPIGWGSYNPFTESYPPGADPERYSDTHGLDLSRAMLRDTVYIPSRGYAILRFRADNPGAWLFHCHILWHLASGMAMVVDVAGYSSNSSAACPLRTIL